MGILKDIFSDFRFVLKLAKNDFKTKFSGSYFGIFWAFVQPVVTVLIYVFVFQVGFRAADTDNGYPYVLWLIAGIVPWFFFSEALMNATNCLIEYSYLVKKVVFKISVLPTVKILSALIVHIFFVGFAVLVYLLNGRFLPLAALQIFYYMFACVCLTVAVAYVTASIVPFFKDFAQLINIVLQVGMWLCPIMWNENLLLGSSNVFINTYLVKILKLNPMYYIVSGYRSCFMGGANAWVWNHPFGTLYFWVLVVALFLIGNKVFKKLKPHFSDVL
ncbi:MAG: ABC transporter permease [Clostridia bacterium]|nr:ABC transporter permease [Clostridia bacterium]